MVMATGSTFTGATERTSHRAFVYAAILPEIRRRFGGEGLGIFADLKSNPLAIIEMARTGVTVDVIRNGHSQIKESLINDSSKFGAVEESAHYYESFSVGGQGRYCTENTLYIALLVARAWHEDPERFDRLIGIQATTAQGARVGLQVSQRSGPGRSARCGSRAFREPGRPAPWTA